MNTTEEGAEGGPAGKLEHRNTGESTSSLLAQMSITKTDQKPMLGINDEQVSMTDRDLVLNLHRKQEAQTLQINEIHRLLQMQNESLQHHFSGFNKKLGTLKMKT